MIDGICALVDGGGGVCCAAMDLTPMAALSRQSTAIHTAAAIVHNKCNAFFEDEDTTVKHG